MYYKVVTPMSIYSDLQLTSAIEAIPPAGTVVKVTERKWSKDSASCFVKIESDTYGGWAPLLHPVEVCTWALQCLPTCETAKQRDYG